VVERAMLEDGDVELVGHERRGDPGGEPGIAAHRRQRARPAALVRHRVRFADAERERGIVIEEEGGDVIVEDEEEHVGLPQSEPVLHRAEGVEDRLP